MIAILLVDDDPGVLRALRLSLRRKRPDWTCVATESGHRAVTELAARAFDVVVTDMRMPGMDGAEVLAHVRAAQPAALRVVLSGYADDAALARVGDTADLVLEKPCAPDDLIRALEDLHARRGAAERRAEAPGALSEYK